jgi:hypothetical protein
MKRHTDILVSLEIKKLEKQLEFFERTNIKPNKQRIIKDKLEILKKR